MFKREWGRLRYRRWLYRIGDLPCGALRTHKGFADCRLRYCRWLYRIGDLPCGALRTHKGFADCRLRYRRWLYRITLFAPYVFSLNEIKLLISILFSKRDPFHILMFFEKAIDEMGGCFARHNNWRFTGRTSYLWKSQKYLKKFWNRVSSIRKILV
jgi:hypothetical protein